MLSMTVVPRFLLEFRFTSPGPNPKYSSSTSTIFWHRGGSTISAMHFNLHNKPCVMVLYVFRQLFTVRIKARKQVLAKSRTMRRVAELDFGEMSVKYFILRAT
jgi:hypothetical protein